MEFVGGVAALGDDLVKPAVQPGHGIREVVCALVRLRDQGRLGVGVRHTFELPRQDIETLINGGKVCANGVLVVVRFLV
jgi:hypothetical protein